MASHQAGRQSLYGSLARRNRGVSLRCGTRAGQAQPRRPSFAAGVPGILPARRAGGSASRSCCRGGWRCGAESTACLCPAVRGPGAVADGRDNGPAQPPPRQFLDPVFVTSWQKEVPSDPFLRKYSRVLRRCWEAWSTSTGDRSRRRPAARPGAPSSFGAVCSTGAARTKPTACAFRTGAACGSVSSGNVTTRPLGDISAGTRRQPWCGGSLIGRGKRATWPSTSAPATPVSEPRRNMWVHAACCTLCLCPRGGAASSGSIGSWAYDGDRV